MAGLLLTDGRAAKVILVGPRDNPKGAVVALSPTEDGTTQIVPLSQLYGVVTPQEIIEIICAQERAFGQSGLEPPDIAS